MSEELTPDPKQAPTHDAQLAAESMAAGEEKTPQVDTDADYEASKAFSVSAIDNTQEGAKAAEAATAPDFKIPEAKETKSTTAESTGNPEDYRQMAKDVNPRVGEGTVDSDQLVKKAIEKGKPGK